MPTASCASRTCAATRAPRARRCGTTSTAAARPSAGSRCPAAGHAPRRRNGVRGSPTACTAAARKRNRERTGLYVKNGSRAPVQLPRPKDAVKFRVTIIDSVDLRGTRVAAVVADIYEYSFSQTTAGKDMRSFFAAASEGESDASARGLAIESASGALDADRRHAQRRSRRGDHLPPVRRLPAARAPAHARRLAAGVPRDRRRRRQRAALPARARQRDRRAHVHARRHAHLPLSGYRRFPRLCSDAASRRPSPRAGRNVAVTWHQ